MKITFSVELDCTDDIRAARRLGIGWQEAPALEYMSKMLQQFARTSVRELERRSDIDVSSVSCQIHKKSYRKPILNPARILWLTGEGLGVLPPEWFDRY